MPWAGNEKAAKLSGINTERLTFLIFVIMGALAALAGLIFAARLNVATPKAGLGFELDVIGRLLHRWRGDDGRCRQGDGGRHRRLHHGVMNNGMSIMGIGIDWQQVIKGAVLMLAVFPGRLLQEQGLTSAVRPSCSAKLMVLCVRPE